MKDNDWIETAVKKITQLKPFNGPRPYGIADEYWNEIESIIRECMPDLPKTKVKFEVISKIHGGDEKRPVYDRVQDFLNKLTPERIIGLTESYMDDMGYHKMIVWYWE